MSRSILLINCILAHASIVADAFSTVVYGLPSELSLLVTKIAAREGADASLICASSVEERFRSLLYGVDTSAADASPDDAKLVVEGEDIERALSNADCMVFVNYEQPVDPQTLNTLLQNCDDEKLSQLVVLSKMGITKSKEQSGFGAFFGGSSGKDRELLASEELIRKTCEEKNLGLAIVRAGLLKGGGPGEDGNEFGLDRCYYSTLVDFLEASVTMAHDKFTLGADCVLGDTEPLPGMIKQTQSKSTFEPLPFDTNRVTVAGATVAAMMMTPPEGEARRRDLEFSVRAAKAEAPPTMDEWSTILQGLK